ncbi:hypothetical protein KP509_05G009300 [Ceratopteris richardii]|uniref:Protein kinase domain-containing protein n=1 Tax=Ceratopteris richardii TaxID=49495 RepID=A0A8T2UNR2_CERRI|nr:hypothetical protein KP509_05G009300 [Ceratopteris richardii]
MDFFVCFNCSSDEDPTEEDCFSCFIPSTRDDKAELSRSSRSKDFSESQDKNLTPELHHRVQSFTFKELGAATCEFRGANIIGDGGFGLVYKGLLAEHNQIVAIKRLNLSAQQGNREFLVELLTLSMLQHTNIMSLIGYCADGDERLLVYEYMPLGSLEDHLHDDPRLTLLKPLSWKNRIKIAAGVARGLEYLHNEASPPVIYRDLKSSNILLNNNYEPKLSDFGLAKLGPVGDNAYVFTRLMGTYGYCPPEYALTNQITQKTDVYSFGIVLLELITGRKAVDFKRREDEQILVDWVRSILEDAQDFSAMADPLLQGQFPIRSLHQAVVVAAMCTQQDASSRPPIRNVVKALTHLESQACDPS